MRAAMIAAALASLVAACGQPASGSGPSPSAGASLTPVAAATLLARPMKLPAVQPGAPCPVTPVMNRSSAVTDPRGRGPLYLGGPMPKGAYP